MGDISKLTADPLANADGQGQLWTLFFCYVLDAEGWTGEDGQSENDAKACLALRQVRGNGARLEHRAVGHLHSYVIVPRKGMLVSNGAWQGLRMVMFDHLDVLRAALPALIRCPRAAAFEALRYATIDGEKVDTDSGEVMGC